MTRDQVVEILLQYRANTAKVDYHSAQLAELNRELRIAKAEMILDCQSITAQISDMPRGTDTTDQTGRLATKFADGFETERVKQIKKEIEVIKSSLDHYQTLVMYVDAWMKCLTDRQRYVLTEKTIKGSFIRDVISGMEKLYGETYSKNGIKRIEATAIDNICAIAG